MTGSQATEVAVLKNQVAATDRKVDKLVENQEKHMERIEELFEGLDQKYAPKWCEQLLKWFLVGSGGILVAQGGKLLTAAAKTITQ